MRGSSLDSRIAWVYVDERRAGVIEQSLTESVFRYDEGFTPTSLRGGGIAWNLPLGDSYRTPGFYQHPFFANLLPEGHRLEAIRTRLKLSKDDGFSLLLAMGRDTVGDVTVVAEGERPGANAHRLEDPSAVDFLELLYEDEAGPSGVPGVQEKVSDARVVLPIEGMDGPCLLKLSPPKFPRLVENESFFMAMAEGCGLLSAKTRVIHDRNGISGLLVARFDRDAEVGKRHQEDACQLADVHPGAKYNLSVRGVTEAVNAFVDTRAVETRRLMELFAFGYLIGNGDLHAKNVSVLRTSRGLTELTPAYDMLSTLPYPLDQRMALKMDGKDDGWKRKSLVKFFERYGLPEKLAQGSLDRICDASSAWIDRLGEIGFDAPTTDRMRREILRRREDLGSGV
jgi:serine/threonine-protein kinase HipA